jgi:hypothetical protein
MGDRNHLVLNLKLVKALEQPKKATMLHCAIDLYLEINISKLFNQIQSNKNNKVYRLYYPSDNKWDLLAKCKIFIR